MKRKSIFVFLLALLLYSCTSTKTFKGSADLHGSVYDVKQRPVANCLIIIDGKEKAKTDSNGRFVVYNLPSGSYEIKTKSSYCESYSNTIQFLNETQYIVISLIDAETIYQLVEDNLEINNVEEAKMNALRLLDINDSDTSALLYLALIYYKQEDFPKAFQILEEANEKKISDMWMDLLKEKVIEQLDRDPGNLMEQ